MFWKQKYPVRETGNDSDNSSVPEPPLEIEEEESVVSYLQEDSTLNDIIDNDESKIKDGGDGNRSNRSDNDEKKNDDDVAASSRQASSCCGTGCCLCSSSCSRLIASLFFVTGAALYIYSSYYAYDYYLKNAAIPIENFIHQQVIFQANAQSDNSLVTDYMAYTFAAAICFAMMGAWNFCGATGTCLSRLCSHGTWTVGAIWAMASSALLIKDESSSLLFHSVSVHLYMMAALVTLCKIKGTCNDNYHLFCCTSLRWLRLADVLLILATMGDVTLSYLYLWKQQVVDDGPLTQEQLLYAGMATAGCWGLCALLYFAVSFVEVCCCRGSKRDEIHRNDDEEEEDLESGPHVYEDNDDDEDDDESQDRNQYAPSKYTIPQIKQEPTEDTANDDASVSSFSSWWTAGPATKEGIARSSLDKIFGR